jgi:hypothetical protein
VARRHPFLNQPLERSFPMGKYVLLWLVGIPIPILILLAIFMR